LIKLRIDVDYLYPSRMRSFINTISNIRIGRDSFKNSKILAQMINDSPEEVKAFWFFTTHTIPDGDLLRLIDNPKHVVALHVVKDAAKELSQLEKATSKQVDYYTIHGTARLFGRVLWRRNIRDPVPKIPQEFQPQSFHQLPTLPVDKMCYACSTEETVKTAEKYVARGEVLEVHPDWLFQRGLMNHRGPCYETLKTILKTDKELDTLIVRKKRFFKIANDAHEYERDIMPTDSFIQKLDERGIDIFTFIERSWCFKITDPPRSWKRAQDNVGLLQIITYDEWQKNVGKKTRNMIRKAEKLGVTTQIAEPSEKLAEGIWRIYNETPIRQERAFPHYGTPLSNINKSFQVAGSAFISASLQDELIGFIQLIQGDKIAIISQILALQKHSDKAVNNALIARAVEYCAEKKINWIMYGRIGNHPSLDTFKQNNGFSKYPITRFYIPISQKGRIATTIGWHRDLKDALPQSLKMTLIPFYNWMSRRRAQTKRPD
jgi:hypothetical protein